VRRAVPRTLKGYRHRLHPGQPRLRMALRRPEAQAGRRCSGTGGVQRMASTGQREKPPELPGVFRADSAPPDSVCAFMQVAGLGPRILRIAKTAPFRYPHRVYEGGLETAFPLRTGRLACGGVDLPMARELTDPARSWSPRRAGGARSERRCLPISSSRS
jgi:hypothetical protein